MSMHITLLQVSADSIIVWGNAILPFIYVVATIWSALVLKRQVENLKAQVESQKSIADHMKTSNDMLNNYANSFNPQKVADYTTMMEKLAAEKAREETANQLDLLKKEINEQKEALTADLQAHNQNSEEQLALLKEAVNDRDILVASVTEKLEKVQVAENSARDTIGILQAELRKLQQSGSNNEQSKNNGTPKFSCCPMVDKYDLPISYTRELAAIAVDHIMIALQITERDQYEKSKQSIMQMASEYFINPDVISIAKLSSSIDEFAEAYFNGPNIKMVHHLAKNKSINN